MSQFKLLPKEWTIIQKIPPGTEAIQTLLTNSADWFFTKHSSIPTDYELNGYLTKLKVFAQINSLPAVPIPDYQYGESKTESLTKTLNAEWNSNRYHLNFYRTKSAALSNIANWTLVGTISLINQSNYPYRTYNILDLYTDLLADPLEEGESIGYAIKNVGFGVPQVADVINIQGSWKQELYSIQPDYQPFVISGGSVSNVTQYTDSFQSAASTTKSQRLSTRPTRLSGYIRNVGTAVTVYYKFDSAITLSAYDGALSPGVTVQLPQAYTGELWVLASSGTSQVLVSETYRA